jgi:hypothetical protein
VLLQPFRTCFAKQAAQEVERGKKFTKKEKENKKNAFPLRLLQLQEFSLRKQTPVDSCSTSAARLSFSSSRAKLAWLLLRQQSYV